MTPEATPPRRQPASLLVLEALAAFIVTAVAPNMATLLFNRITIPAFMEGSAPSLLAPASYAPMLLILVLVAATLWARSEIVGWLAVTAGLAGIVVLHVVRRAQLPGDAGFFLTAAALGVAIGGVLMVIGRAAGIRRAVILAGMVIGMLWWSLPYRWIDSALFQLEWYETSAVVVMAAIGAVLAMAAAVVLRAQASWSDPEPERSPSWGPLAVVLSAAALLLAGNLVRHEFAEAAIGRHTDRREEAYAAFTYHTETALAVIVAAMFLWYGYRRARVPSARWMVTGCGLGSVVVAGLSTGRISQGAEYVVIPISIAAVIAGVMVALWLPKVLPWEAMGLLAVAIGLVLVSPALGDRAPAAGLGGIGAGLIMSGAGFALAAAIAGLRSVPAEMAAAHLGLGFAGMLLTGFALAPVVYTTQMFAGPGFGKSPALTLPLFTAGAAVVIVFLFGWQRFVVRVRRHIESEARSEITQSS